MLTNDEKCLLLSIARTTIENYLNDGSKPLLPEMSESLTEIRGAFVSLHRLKELRGCIGHIIGKMPLAETVQEMAIAAATQDPRFPTLSPEELEDIDIEISALTPLEKIDANDVEVGKHGLLIARGQFQGVLLPQVPVEYGWTRTQFLENTCVKASLPTDAWQDEETEIYAFTAEVFGERELGRQ